MTGQFDVHPHIRHVDTEFVIGPNGIELRPGYTLINGIRVHPATTPTAGNGHEALLRSGIRQVSGVLHGT